MMGFCTINLWVVIIRIGFNGVKSITTIAVVMFMDDGLCYCFFLVAFVSHHIHDNRIKM